MAKQNTKSKKGFTIIEVVLVLAIAGLIFLMVFIALPALQRSQRDTQRRDDMARFMSQLSQYQSNNAGNTPNTKAEAGKTDQVKYNDFIKNYLEAGGDSFNDPSTGERYIIQRVCSFGGTGCADPYNGENADGAMGHIYVYTGAKCNGESVEATQGARKIAITLKLEGAGVYCGNN